MIATNSILKLDKTLFWDTKMESLNIESDKFYIIKRIILRGDKKDRIVMFTMYDFETIKNVVISSREIPENLKTVWLKVLQNE